MLKSFCVECIRGSLYGLLRKGIKLQLRHREILTFSVTSVQPYAMQTAAMLASWNEMDLPRFAYWALGGCRFVAKPVVCEALPDGVAQAQSAPEQVPLTRPQYAQNRSLDPGALSGAIAMPKTREKG